MTRSAYDPPDSTEDMEISDPQEYALKPVDRKMAVMSVKGLSVKQIAQRTKRTVKFVSALMKTQAFVQEEHAIVDKMVEELADMSLASVAVDEVQKRIPEYLEKLDEILHDPKVDTAHLIKAIEMIVSHSVGKPRGGDSGDSGVAPININFDLTQLQRMNQLDPDGSNGSVLTIEGEL